MIRPLFIVSALVVATFGLPACGGGSVVAPVTTGAAQAAAAATIPVTAASSATAGCPPSTPDTLTSGNGPEVLLKIVGGGAAARDRGEPNAAGAVDLYFAADGSFLEARRGDNRPPRGAAMELDVRTVPDVSDLRKYQWALYHQATTPLAPFVLALASVQEIPPSYVVPATVPSYLVTDGAGNVLNGVANTHGLSVALSYPSSTPRPITLLTFASTTPESHCGNCWEVLWH